ncbi:DNA polymerase IV [Erysipelotrichaceae bacterium 66-17]
MASVLFHIDLNAFFANAEMLRHPEYKGKPLAIGSLSSRSVLATANYEARKFGVHSAMPVFQAKEKCPELVIVSGDYEYYRKLSSRFFAYLRRYSDKLEPLSIDECFLDVTEQIKKYPRPLDMAVQIQQGVLKEIGLSCSIGVGPNRFLAKMASDMKKPMGIMVLRKSEIRNKLWPLPIEQMYGIGKKTVPLLKKEGIEKIGDLVDPRYENTVKRILGKNALVHMQRANGQSSAKLEFSSTPKSVSVSRTFRSDIYTLDEAFAQAQPMVSELCAKLKKEKQKGKLVSVILRDTTFRNQMRSMSLPAMSDEYPVIWSAVSELLTDNFEEVGYRHIGVSIGSLRTSDQIVVQPTIFEEPVNTTRDIVASLNRSLDTKVFMTAADLLKKKEQEKDDQ